MVNQENMYTGTDLGINHMPVCSESGEYFLWIGAFSFGLFPSLFCRFDHILLNTQSSVETLQKKKVKLCCSKCKSVNHSLNVVFGLLFAFDPVFYHLKKVTNSEWTRSLIWSYIAEVIAMAIAKLSFKSFSGVAVLLHFLFHPHKQIHVKYLGNTWG